LKIANELIEAEKKKKEEEDAIWDRAIESAARRQGITVEEYSKRIETPRARPVPIKPTPKPESSEEDESAVEITGTFLPPRACKMGKIPGYSVYMTPKGIVVLSNAIETVP
jgi:hypothetical protein